MQCKDRLEAHLRDNHVAFELQHHPRVYTAQEIAASEHIPGKLLAKVVVARADDRLVMLALPASFRVQESKLAPALGAREARIAREEEFAKAFPDCETGAMPPFGNLYGLQVVVDRSLTDDDTIVVRAGTHTDTLSLKYADFVRLVDPIVADFALHP